MIVVVKATGSQQPLFMLSWNLWSTVRVGMEDGATVWEAGSLNPSCITAAALYARLILFFGECFITLQLF